MTNFIFQKIRLCIHEIWNRNKVFKGFRFGVQYLWEKEILVREQLFHHAIESKTHDHFRCKTFYKIHTWLERQYVGLESRLAKSFFWQKAFDEIWGKTKQNIGQWNIFDLPWAGSVFIVMANICALHILLTVLYSRLRDNGGESRIRAKEIFWQEYAS